MCVSAFTGTMATLLIGATLSAPAYSGHCDEVASHGTPRPTSLGIQVSEEFYALPIIRRLRADHPDFIPSPEINNNDPITAHSWAENDPSVRWLISPLRQLRPWIISESRHTKEAFNLYSLPQAHSLVIAHMDYLMSYAKKNHPHLYPGIQRMTALHYMNLEKHYEAILRNCTNRADEIMHYMNRIKGYEGEVRALIELPNVLDVSFRLNAGSATARSKKEAKEFFEQVATRINHNLHRVLQNKARFAQDFPVLYKRVESLPLIGNKEAILRSRILGEKEFDILYLHNGELSIAEVKNLSQTLDLETYKPDVSSFSEGNARKGMELNTLDSVFREFVEIQKLTLHPVQPDKPLFNVAGYFPNSVEPPLIAVMNNQGIVVISRKIPVVSKSGASNNH